MEGMSYIRSKEYGEEICYYLDDLEYSYTVLGCGYDTGKAYNITFDENGKVLEVEEIYTANRRVQQ